MNIEQTVSAAVADLQLGHTFTLDDLIHAIQARRQRTLRVHELQDLDTSDGLCAIWLIGETEDVVLHAPSDSALHRQQFVLHEFAHMILGHCEGEDCAAEITAEALADRLAAGIRGHTFAESGYLEVFG